MESDATSYEESEIQDGKNFYVNRGSRNATISVYQTGNIKVTAKKNSTQFKEDLEKLKEDIYSGRVIPETDPDIFKLIENAAGNYKSGKLTESVYFLNSASVKIMKSLLKN